ncbi:hypothetical protein, partial [Burkholderia gladioli]|uniref:hypothetical protein n=1 Tax=Burkholderia gladioli TaxID=28095 RepID=UPI003F7A6EB2
RHQNLQCMLLPSPGWLVLNRPITRGFGGFDHYQLALPVIAWAYWPGTRIAPLAPSNTVDEAFMSIG